jgi:hypothetical protein
MKKLFLKNVIHTILALCFINLIASCSTEDDKASVEITKFEVNKTSAYIGENITLDFDGTGYQNIYVRPLNPTATTKLTQLDPLNFKKYQISATAPVTSAVFIVTLRNGNDKAEKSTTLNFCTHDVDNFSTIEGIKKDDVPSKVLDLLGVPTQKTPTTLIVTTTIAGNPATTTTTTVEGERWAYPSKGISVSFIKSTERVGIVSLMSSIFYVAMNDGTKVNYTNYTGNLGNGWKINDPATNMNSVIAKLGTPTLKTVDTNNGLITYTFSNNAKFSFIGATENDYAGKVIQHFSL